MLSWVVTGVWCREKCARRNTKSRQSMRHLEPNCCNGPNIWWMLKFAHCNIFFEQAIMYAIIVLPLDRSLLHACILYEIKYDTSHFIYASKKLISTLSFGTSKLIQQTLESANTHTNNVPSKRALIWIFVRRWLKQWSIQYTERTRCRFKQAEPFVFTLSR